MIRYGSVCSGIEAATVAWHALAWRAAFFAEIDPFPCALLAHHYPAVPNLGNITRFKEWPDADIDVLVGGTPCQSFSIAGLRQGLADPRGNLALTYLAIAQRYRPRWVVWENVPGVISDKTDALTSMLDGLEDLGYVVDIDILDAQFHGVPQRRRRVFICGQHRDDLINQRTDSSALTIAQCWLEILHAILADQFRESVSELQAWDSAYLSRDGVFRRMKLFGMLGESSSYDLLRENLVAAFQRCLQEPKLSAAALGENAEGFILDGQSMASVTEARYLLTESSLRSALEESYDVMKSFITSTSTNSITQTAIFSCSRAVLLIGKLIHLLSHSSPPWWSAASSALITTEAFTDYARFASSDLFGDMERLQAWRNFIEQAERAIDALADTGVECFGQILSVRESLSGHPAPSRAAREGVARPIGAGSPGGSGYRNDADTAENLIANHVSTRGGQRLDAESETLVAHALRAEGFDASEDGTGRGTPLVPVAAPLSDGSNPNSNAAGRRREDDENLIAFHARQDPDSGSVTHPLDTDACSIAVMTGIAVRRLTPTEAERLQGFQDGYTAVPFRGKPAGDAPRYKALGNSFAVPVVRWIGSRIQMVEGLCSSASTAA